MSKMERLAHFGEATGLSRLVRRLGAWRGLLTFTYHRVGTVDSAYDSGLWDASPENLERQLELLEREFDVIAPDELTAALRRRRGRYVLLTFDDGYRDNFCEAFPILKRHGIPATFFVTTGFLDSRRISWWDEIAWIVHTSGLWPQAAKATTKALIDVCKSVSGEARSTFLDALGDAAGTGRHRPAGDDLWMTWDDVRALRAGGMHVGGHTVNHPVLGRLPADEQEREIAGCKERIEAELGEPMRYFSYPHGDSFDQNTRRALARHGVELAFSLYGGYRTADDWDPYDVRRCCVGITVSPQRFALMLTVPQLFARP